MIKRVQIKTYLFILLFSLLPVLAFAAPVPQWQIVPSESSLTFTAIQNGSPVTGTFKTFTGEINFDPEQLAASHVKITVDIGSLSAPYAELVDTLKTSAWFDMPVFPQAVFTANHFKKLGDKTYEGDGILTIRDKSIPIALKFTQEEYSPTTARVKGTATLKRTAFGVGQGEWANTDAVKDEVRVDFVLKAVRK